MKTRTPKVFLLLGALFVALIVLAACGGVEMPSRNVRGEAAQEVDLQPRWIVTVPAGHSRGKSTMHIYQTGNFYWAVEFGNHPLDDFERIGVLNFLSGHFVEIDNAEVKNEQKIMFIYPDRKDAEKFGEDRERINIIAGGLIDLE